MKKSQNLVDVVGAKQPNNSINNCLNWFSASIFSSLFLFFGPFFLHPKSAEQVALLQLCPQKIKWNASTQNTWHWFTSCVLVIKRLITFSLKSVLAFTGEWAETHSLFRPDSELTLFLPKELLRKERTQKPENRDNKAVLMIITSSRSCCTYSNLVLQTRFPASHKCRRWSRRHGQRASIPRERLNSTGGWRALVPG